MKIDKNIPIPTGLRGAKRKYPFNDMEVGDSFFCPSDISTTEQVRNAADQYTRRTGRRFSVRKQDGGCRIWRVE